VKTEEKKKRMMENEKINFGKKSLMDEKKRRFFEWNIKD
jgi:hypothetical protein